MTGMLARLLDWRSPYFRPAVDGSGSLSGALVGILERFRVAIRGLNAYQQTGTQTEKKWKMTWKLRLHGGAGLKFEKIAEVQAINQEPV